MAAYRARVSRASVESLRSGIGACMSHDMHGTLARIQAPTLVMAGSEDRLVPPFHSEYLSSAIPNAALTADRGERAFSASGGAGELRWGRQGFSGEPELSEIRYIPGDKSLDSLACSAVRYGHAPKGAGLCGFMQSALKERDSLRAFL
jgi:hypothetical protein